MKRDNCRSHETLIVLQFPKSRNEKNSRCGYTTHLIDHTCAKHDSIYAPTFSSWTAKVEII